MFSTSPLATQNECAIVHVKNIQSDSKTQVKLLGLGIGIGSTLEVLRNRGGDMVLANNNIRISLGRSIANKILVASDKSGDHNHG
jgi:Fe2+ transport system protein FeoA